MTATRMLPCPAFHLYLALELSYLQYLYYYVKVIFAVKDISRMAFEGSSFWQRAKHLGKSLLKQYYRTT